MMRSPVRSSLKEKLHPSGVPWLCWWTTRCCLGLSTVDCTHEGVPSTNVSSSLLLTSLHPATLTSSSPAWYSSTQATPSDTPDGYTSLIFTVDEDACTVQHVTTTARKVRSAMKRRCECVPWARSGRPHVLWSSDSVPRTHRGRVLAVATSISPGDPGRRKALQRPKGGHEGACTVPRVSGSFLRGELACFS
eukprot:scaffold840_cov344-Pavlova_lutheri.AAC.90